MKYSGYPQLVIRLRCSYCELDHIYSFFVENGEPTSGTFHCPNCETNFTTIIEVNLYVGQSDGYTGELLLGQLHYPIGYDKYGKKIEISDSTLINPTTIGV